MKMVDCPGCGNPLIRRSKKGRYYCENDGCLVIFVKRPHNPAIRQIIYKPSASKDAIQKIEEKHMFDIYASKQKNLS